MDYHRLVVIPTAQNTLPQPGLQRRWTALPGEALSAGGESDAGLAEGGDRHLGNDCPLPLVDDLRSGFAGNEPLIAAKQCFDRTQRSHWFKDTCIELQPLVDVTWRYDQAGLRNWRTVRSPGAPEEHPEQLGYNQ